MKANLLKTAIIATFIILSNNVFSQIIIEETHTDCWCNGDMTGTIDLIVSGGVPVYAFEWSGPSGYISFLQNIEDLPAGTYCVTITDTNSDTVSQCITISETTPIVITPTITNNICAGDTLASITANVSGGTPSYSYAWMGPSVPMYGETQNITNLLAGEYCLTVIDNYGCDEVECFTLTDPDSLQISLDDIVNTTNGICNGSIDVSTTNGTAPYVYSWSNGETTSLINNLCPTNYSLLVSDVNNCEVEANYNIGSSYDATYTFVDTVDITIDTCIFSNTLPVDSALIYSYETINPDSIVLNWIFWQDGNSILLDIGVNLDTQGSNLVYLQINCSSKATNTYSFYGAFDASTTDVQKMEVVDVNIYPNPTTGNVQLIINNEQLGSTVQIININGVVIKQITVNKEQCTINLSNQPKGIYFVKLIGDGFVNTQKIVLE